MSEFLHSSHRLSLFELFHIFKVRRKSKRLVLFLRVISEEVRNKGMDAVLGIKLISDALQKRFASLDSHLIMKENYKMRREIERLDNSVYIMNIEFPKRTLRQRIKYIPLPT